MAWKGWENYSGPTKDRPPTASAPALPKFLNRKTVANDGTLCDSKTEARRWDELCLLRNAEQIRDLLPHPSFPLYVNGAKPGRITFDALYVDRGALTCEDTKSPRTRQQAAYRQRVRLFLACYPHIRFHEYTG